MQTQLVALSKQNVTGPRKKSSHDVKVMFQDSDIVEASCP